MKRYLGLAAAAIGAVSLAVPVHAATGYGSGTNGLGSALPPALVKHAVQAVQTADLHDNLKQLMEHATGFFIVPSFRFGKVAIGPEGGYGLLLAQENHGWSDPAFYTVGRGAVGPGADHDAGSVIMLLMNRKAVRAFAESDAFAMAQNAGLRIVSYSPQVKVNNNTADVIVWSDKGTASGNAVLRAPLKQDVPMDHEYYGQNVGTAQILAGQSNNLSANKLRRALPG